MTILNGNLEIRSTRKENSLQEILRENANLVNIFPRSPFFWTMHIVKIKLFNGKRPATPDIGCKLYTSPTNPNKVCSRKCTIKLFRYLYWGFTTDVLSINYRIVSYIQKYHYLTIQLNNVTALCHEHSGERHLYLMIISRYFENTQNLYQEEINHG